jgi:amino acid transporter
MGMGSRWGLCVIERSDTCNVLSREANRFVCIEPSYFVYVDVKTRVPMRAVLSTCFICLLVALLNIGSGTSVALDAITSLSSLGLYLTTP